MTIRVLIVDDHAVVRQGLLFLLEANPEIEVLDEVDGGAAAVALAGDLRPDLILMDLIMPEMSGVEAIQHIKTLHPSIKIMALTSSIEDHIVKQALEAGADGYILKASPAEDLLAAIRQVMQGFNVLDPAVTQVIFKARHGQDDLDTLTEREHEVFDLLARGLNSPEIAATLNVTEATVRTHTASILDKLRLRDRTQLMIYALKRNLVQLDDLDFKID